MSRTELKRVAAWIDLEAGKWVAMANGTIWVACGGCGERAELTDHQVDAEGLVTPSLVCPVGCGWHVYAKLLEYDPNEEREV